ncbi:twitching motility protein PilT [Leptolyngbya sp. UWPOB_LEPTO1]|uniref:type II toxin-antitoxin system VapC family toxin n=1 Tax=Leptolyngbya sp. UWPOB_LEPTO1 TaxID=2815653 RepID=UPI002579AF33|nr:twitching motility protein PilT [Leptolyngbya sp. UWPOB_LEPTO1]
MRALLDTHALLWWVTNNSQLSAPVQDIISNPENTLYLSVASSWEIIINPTLASFPFQNLRPNLFNLA